LKYSTTDEELNYSMTSIVEEAEMVTGQQLSLHNQKVPLLVTTEFADFIGRMQRSDSERFY